LGGIAKRLRRLEAQDVRVRPAGIGQKAIPSPQPRPVMRGAI
jgi:hypothetical protein